MTVLSRWHKVSALIKQYFRFNLIGILGIFVQLTVLTVLTHLAKMHYLAATVFGVEAAVIHNFVWHERWTWAHRAQGGTKEMLQRLLRFNATTGTMSILGNLFFMKIFVGFVRLPVLPSNLLTVGCCNVLNFTVSEYFVFRSNRVQQ